MDLLESVQHVLSEVGLTVREQQTLPGRFPVNVPIPANLHPRVVELLKQQFPGGLWKHQAAAIEHAVRGHSVCVATQTASGKSLIFMAYAAHVLLSDPTACIITFYPTKSLIQDQRLKWSHLFRPLGLDFGYIDGGIPVERRADILRGNRLLLMTPDVAHSWLLSSVSETWVRSYLARLTVVILDEAHVYDGVFGTNFAYLMRRLLAISNLRQILAASATLGEPERFLEDLTGLPVLVLGPAEDGAPVYEKTVLLAGALATRRSGRRGDDFRTIVNVVRRLVNVLPTPFLAFADSRRMVEHVVSALHSRAGDAAADGSDDFDTDSTEHMKRQVLPYRAGYEEEDRVAIQQALMNGALGGVVSTSALELGIDIGHIDVVALLQPPGTRKAFWQRLGRCGRARPGVCILLDLDGRVRLDHFLGMPSEPNRLYLENPYLQYTNALCAANELASLGVGGQSLERFVNVPREFLRLLENELEPTEPLPPELTVLKQRASTTGPHSEFPLRNAIDEVFDVFDRSGRRLGQVTYSQALREAYPGAVYYYLARPYRVVRFDFRNKRIEVRTEKRYTTRPDLLQLAFPRWPEGVLGLWRSAAGGFVVESEMQVSEKLIGFTEHRGSVRESHRYESGSMYYPRPLLRFFETTGVAWWFPQVKLNEDLARVLLASFCDLCGVQERDVALGWFYAKRSPVASGEVSGWCIYDSTYGSLRLTQQLAERFSEVVWDALRRCDQDRQANEALWALLEVAEQLVPDTVPQVRLETAEPVSDDWVVVVARGERAMYFKAEATEEVVIQDFRYTPRGIVYDIEPGNGWDRRQVPFELVKPIHGVTRQVRWNLVTGEEQLIEE